MKIPIKATIWMSIVLFAASTGYQAAGKDEPGVPLTEKGAKLETRYAGNLKTLQAEIAKVVPQIDAKKSEAFMAAYRAVGEARGSAWRNKGQFATTFKPVAEAQEKTLEIACPILREVGSFLAKDTLDAKLAKCAVLTNATPRGLAEFAQQGGEQEQLVDQLLTNPELMLQMLEAGGAKLGKYGTAMQTYTGIMAASEHARKGGILGRLALGTSVELTLSAETRTDEVIDPVKRYLHYEKAFLDGELDPAFPTLTAWECRFVVDSEAPDEELAWGRAMLRAYRPDHLFNKDYRWRYSGAVKTDVAYKRSDPQLEGISWNANIMNGGGVCGKRAFFGRFILKAFGIPTFGVRQRQHAALSHWTPAGWTINLGGGWVWSWWDRPGHSRSGEDFLLETQVREYPAEFMKVLRAEWIGDALGEEKRDRRKLGSGGLWNALALYQERMIVAEAKPTEVALAGEDLAEANEPTKAEQIMTAEITAEDKKIDVSQDGTITIPAVACSNPTNNTPKIAFMKSFSGGMQLHYNRLNKPEPFEYTFEAPAEGKYELTARVVTVNVNQQLTLKTNDAAETVEISLPHTVGAWQVTKPVEVSLVKGRNVLHFTRNDPNSGVTIKDFTLKPVK